MASKFSGRCPDGTVTTSTKKYLAAWRAKAAPVTAAFGWKLRAFDPGLSFWDENMRAVDVDARGCCSRSQGWRDSMKYLESALWILGIAAIVVAWSV